MKKATNSDPIFVRIDNLLSLKQKKQKELIDYLNIRKTSYSEWKSGISTTYLSYIEAISDYLETSPNYLITGNSDDTFVASVPSLDEMDMRLLSAFRPLNSPQKEKVIQVVEILASY